MHRMKKIMDCSVLGLRKWPSNPRIYAIALLLIGYVGTLVLPVADFCAAVDISAYPWVFPFLTVGKRPLMFLMMGLVLLFCDAPFIDAHQPLVIVRTGKSVWLAGQVLYIILASAIYFLFVYIVSTVMLLPHLSFGSEWGKVWTTLARTNAGQQFGIVDLVVNHRIQNLYTPIGATLWSFFLDWLTGCFLGMLMFLCNLMFNKTIGALVANGFVLLSLFMYDASVYALFYFSPVSWASLYIVDPTGTNAMPSTGYAVGMLAGLIIVLIIVCGLYIRHMDIEVTSQI